MKRKYWDYSLKTKLICTVLISENYEIQKKKSHEFKNHILCIESLLKAHEYDKASKYVRNISNTFIGEKNVISTNHVIINAT